METWEQNHLEQSFPDFPFLSLFSSTPYFILALYYCSQQEFWSFTMARIESLSVFCFPSVSFFFLALEHFCTFAH